MDNKKIGQFISELRRSNHMTQKDLAAALNITDKAVSKWERGLSYPDISLLPSIADILLVTTGELLNGERNNPGSEDVEASIGNALHYADKTAQSKLKSLQGICAALFSLLLLSGIAVCAVCDMAISGAFTWSLFPISSIIFSWMIFFPAIRWGLKGIPCTLIALSILIVPFLYVLNCLIKTSDLLLPIGVPVSFVSIVFLWVVFALFTFLKARKLLAGALSLLTAVPTYVLINFSLSKIISEPLVDVWDVLSFSVIGIAAAALFALDYMKRKKED